MPSGEEDGLRYDRALFGGWADADGDCRSTRHEVLAELSTVPGPLVRGQLRGGARALDRPLHRPGSPRRGRARRRPRGAPGLRLGARRRCVRRGRPRPLRRRPGEPRPHRGAGEPFQGRARPAGLAAARRRGLGAGTRCASRAWRGATGCGCPRRRRRRSGWRRSRQGSAAEGGPRQETPLGTRPERTSQRKRRCPGPLQGPLRGAGPGHARADGRAGPRHQGGAVHRIEAPIGETPGRRAVTKLINSNLLEKHGGAAAQVRRDATPMAVGRRIGRSPALGPAPV